MDRPLISHPNRDEPTEAYTEDQLTDNGGLRLDAHNRAVGERAVRLFEGDGPGTTYLHAAATLHDFGKATPQFQAHVRPDEAVDVPSEEVAHARLGALATWYVLGELDAPDRDRLACTLAVARHHQALPNAHAYTAQPLAEAFEDGTGAIQAQLDAIDDRWPAAAGALLAQTDWPNPDWGQFYRWASSGDAATELRRRSAKDRLYGPKPSTDALPEKLYDRTLRYWSAITLADKSHAMDIPEPHVFDFDTLDRETIEEYIETLRDDPPASALEARLNDERERARRQAIHGVHEWLQADDDGSQIATLTLPTGLGKTFTGLSAAFETRDLLAEQGRGSERPIIYALPYTSIIEQTRSIFEDPDLWGADPERSALTVHHYLSQTIVRHDQYDERDVTDDDNEEAAALLGEAWRDGTVLTTFVQLFESLAGPTNREGLKLPALRESIVILDEPQALPKDWWDGIERLFEVLTDEYGARVIAMTATQPSLVRNLDTESLLTAGRAHEQPGCRRCRAERSYDQSLPAEPKASYFDASQRVRYTIDPTALSKQLGEDETHVGYGTAADRILDATDASGSTLAICNTISSSRELIEHLTERRGTANLGSHIEAELADRNVRGDASGAAVESIVDGVVDRLDSPDSDSEADRRTVLLTLNSRYRPFDRQILIELADRLSTSDIPFVLVSTQAIEAGVDLSFRTVFRDIAPLDSIVQAAGRCNRSYEWGENGGRVVVWMLAAPEESEPRNPTDPPPAHYVYEKGATKDGIPTHLELIARVLGGVPDPADAPDVAVSREAVRAYFEALEQKSLWSGDIRTAIDDAQGQWLGRQSLIRGRATLDVLVGVTAADREAIEEVSELLQLGVPAGYERLEQLAAVRVSLPKSVIEETPQLSRLDRRDRNDDGVYVFEYLGGGGLEYDFENGGLAPSKDPIGDRFTT